MGAAISQGFSMLFAKVAAVLGWIGDLFKAVFVALWDVIKDAFCWVLEQGLGLAYSAISAVPLVGITENMSVWGSIPAGVLEVMSALGLGTAFAIITAAIGVRLVLQLIPFTRLGS